jgi:hypothetical protein
MIGIPLAVLASNTNKTKTIPLTKTNYLEKQKVEDVLNWNPSVGDFPVGEFPKPAPTPTPVVKVAQTKPVQVSAPKADIVNAVIKWANYYNVSSSTLLRVMWCESGGNPSSINHGYTDPIYGTHPTGLFQHVSGYWSGRVKKYSITGTDIFDYNTNAQITAAMFADGQAGQWACK